VLAAVAAGGVIMRKPLSPEARLRRVAAIRANADAFARSLAAEIAALEREGVMSSSRMTSAVWRRPAPGAGAPKTVNRVRRRLKRLGL
jgi:hypothetical protein